MILSFGEIIWDVYPDKALIGGAALNFSAHAAKCGEEVCLLSAVGQDDLGGDALTAAESFGVRTDFIKRLGRKTGQCLVTLDSNGVPSYDVLRDVAYDHITVTREDLETIKALAPETLYFGTLIQRSAVSRDTLQKICAEHTFREIICDVNLRKNCYDRDSVEFCLKHATVLKVSEEEEPLMRSLGLYACDTNSHLSIAQTICQTYPQIKHILLTCGEQGCFVYSSDTGAHFFENAKRVRVASTVGAGDSFTAAFVSQYLSRKSIKEAVNFAAELSGFVVSKTDAIPRYAVENGEIKSYAPILQAHRGVAAEYPENTMIAFRAAIRQGYGYIELDPAYTKDHQMVVLHDSTINRTARTAEGMPLAEKIHINDISYDEAVVYDYGAWLAPRFKGEKIPLLREALCLAREHGVKVKIDNKVERFCPEASEALHRLMEEFENTVALTGGKADVIEFYAQKFPRAELHYDGPVDEAVMARLTPLSDRLTVWLPYRSSLTSWVTVPFADETLCALVKKHAKLGIWIIGDYEAYEDVCERFAPDLVETTGAIKPRCREGLCFDMHTHSRNSHDSKTPVADSAKICQAKGLAGFAVTDHLDVQHYHGQDISSHIADSAREVEAAAQAYTGQMKILRGVEIGEGIWHEDYVTDLLKKQNFDVVLGSVHAVRYKDMHMAYSGIDFSVMSEEDLHGYLSLYFDEVMTMLDTIPCDIVTHLTCPLRYINEKYKRGVDITRYEPQIEAILRRIIDRALVLEVNTSCDAFYMPDEWIVKKYRDMGGCLASLGSDAHISQNLGKSFDNALDLLRRLGFRHCYYFEDRIGIPCTI